MVISKTHSLELIVTGENNGLLQRRILVPKQQQSIKGIKDQRSDLGS